MKKSQLLSLLTLSTAFLGGCIDDHLTTEPPTILTDEQVWSNPDMLTGVLANFYSRLPDYLNFNGETPHNTWASYDEALYSGITNADQVNGIIEYGYNTASTWNYGIVRDINLAIDNVTAAQSAALTEQIRSETIAELRFLRAWVYFDMVKRMGGVPLITEQMIYDFGGDPSYLRRPRNTEAETYEFIADEVDAIIDDLGNAGSRSRANRYTALALKSRAMLYAASIAKHNAEMPGGGISTPGGEVGIPASRADEFYQASLDASLEIINNGPYELYEVNPDPGENFYETIVRKAGNTEVIWARDYSVSGGVIHHWTLTIVPPSLSISALSTNRGGGLSPSLQLVETFDQLDGSPGVFEGVGDGTVAGQANWIYYDTPEEIFEGRDGRLYGTVIYPGTSARGSQVQIQAGVYRWNEATGQYDKYEGGRNDGYEFNPDWVVTGADGPRAVENYVTTTGFYLRKYMDPVIANATSATGSDVWLVRFRLGEIYLNAAEAAFELGLEGEALGYINALRERAGFPPNSLTMLTRDKLRSERWAELAFEDHRFWDLKRWRTAHLVWDGGATSETANINSLWGYRIDRPGHPNHGKWVYDKFKSQRQTQPRYFRLGNYYSAITAGTIGNNPLIVPNPFH